MPWWGTVYCVFLTELTLWRLLLLRRPHASVLSATRVVGAMLLWLLAPAKNHCSKTLLRETIRRQMVKILSVVRGRRRKSGLDIRVGSKVSTLGWDQSPRLDDIVMSRKW